MVGQLHVEVELEPFFLDIRSDRVAAREPEPTTLGLLMKLTVAADFELGLLCAVVYLKDIWLGVDFARSSSCDRDVD